MAFLIAAVVAESVFNMAESVRDELSWLMVYKLQLLTRASCSTALFCFLNGILGFSVFYQLYKCSCEFFCKLKFDTNNEAVEAKAEQKIE